jgi:hypothetical protein
MIYSNFDCFGFNICVIYTFFNSILILKDAWGHWVETLVTRYKDRVKELISASLFVSGFLKT